MINNVQLEIHRYDLGACIAMGRHETASRNLAWPPTGNEIFRAAL